MVHGEKKDGQIGCFIDFGDFNKVCRRDEFSLHNMDMLVYATADHVMLLSPMV